MIDMYGREISIEEKDGVKIYRVEGIELSFDKEVPESSVISTFNAMMPEGWVAEEE